MGASYLLSSVWLDIFLAVLCIICAALAAGLTIGLVSLNQNELILLVINGTESEKFHAKRILPLLDDYHTLIVTLFLFNAVANEALPIFVSGFVHKYYAILIATILVLVFGEILPSSVFSGPNQLKIASSLFPVTVVLLVLFYPLAKPIGLILDMWLGTEAHRRAPFDAKDLYTLLSLSEEGRSPLSANPAERMAKSECKENSPSLLAPLLPPLASSKQSSYFHNQSLVHSVAAPRAAPSILCSDIPLSPLSDSPPFHSNSSPSSQHCSAHLHAPPRSFPHKPLFLNRDSVLIAQGAILCSRKHLGSIVQSSFVATSAEARVDVQWFEQMGHQGFSRVLVQQRKEQQCHRDERGMKGGQLIGYIVLKELFRDLHSYLCPSLCPGNTNGISEPLQQEQKNGLINERERGESIEALLELEREPQETMASPQHVTVRQLPMHPLEYFSPLHTVLHALNVMQSGVSRVGVLTVDGTRQGAVLGFFTLEDVLEEVIQEEIHDEKDIISHSPQIDDTLAQLSSASFVTNVCSEAEINETENSDNRNDGRSEEFRHDSV